MSLASRLATVLLSLCISVPALATDALDRGRDLFLFGKGVEARIGPEGVAVPGSSFACKNCHGMNGAGKREGSTVFPPVEWPALARATRARPAYGRVEAVRAIRKGVGVDGAVLDGVMPRYMLSEADSEALVSYLEHVAAEQASGVTTTEARFGVLAGGSYARLGADLTRQFNVQFGRINARRGIYDRSLAVVELSNPDATETDHFRAVVSLISDRDTDAQQLARAGVPNVFSFTPIGGDEYPDLLRGIGASLIDIAEASVSRMTELAVRDLDICATTGDDRLASAMARAAEASSLRVGMRALDDCLNRPGAVMFVVPRRALPNFPPPSSGGP